MTPEGSGEKIPALITDFFDVKENPYITFHFKKIVQTGLETFHSSHKQPGL